MSEHKRFIISIPYYAEDVSEIRETIKKLSQAVEFPYASISSQFEADNHKTIFLESVETEINEEITTMNFNDAEMKLLPEAVELLYNRIIGEMMYKTEDDLRNLLDKINQNN